MNGRPQSMLQVPPGRGTEPTRAQLVRGSEPVEKVHLRLEWVWSCWASKRPPWGAAPKTPGEQGPSLQAQGLNRPPPSQPQMAGCGQGSGSPAPGAVLALCSAPCWVGSSGVLTPRHGPLASLETAPEPVALCGLSAWPVSAQVIGYRPQGTASPWAQSACISPSSVAASGTKLI